MERPLAIDVLYEDNHCLAVLKPAGILSQGDRTGAPSLETLVRQDLKSRYQKPGNVYLGLLHRLDQPVSGVVLLAKTGKAAARLSEQWRQGAVEKVYWGVVEGTGLPAEDEWVDWLAKDTARNVVRVEAEGHATARRAETGARVLMVRDGLTLVELRPRSGRFHQLRVQAASRGWPLVGDRKYGASRVYQSEGVGHRIALHARELRFAHPTRKEPVVVTAPLPDDWPVPLPGTE